MGRILAVLASEKRTNGGLSDNDANELTVTATCSPSGAGAHDGDTGRVTPEYIPQIARAVASYSLSLCASSLGAGQTIGGHKLIDHAGRPLPVTGAEGMSPRNHLRPGIEHLILQMARTELRTHGIPGQLKEFHPAERICRRRMLRLSYTRRSPDWQSRSPKTGA